MKCFDVKLRAKQPGSLEKRHGALIDPVRNVKMIRGIPSLGYVGRN